MPPSPAAGRCAGSTGPPFATPWWPPSDWWTAGGGPPAPRVASLREVDWARFEPNFFVVFAPGALERAPQTFVTLTRIERAADRGALQRRIAERVPNVTSVDLSTVQETL